MSVEKFIDEYPSLDFVGDQVTVKDVRERLENHYGSEPGEREIYVKSVENAYQQSGSVYFSLEGTPPKGHAIYIKEGQLVIFCTVTGRVFERWENVDLEVEQYG